MTNTPLVPVFTGTISNQSVQFCNARDLYQFLEVGKDFSTWIKNRIAEYGFIQDEDYSPILGNRSDGKPGKRRTEYHLTRASYFIDVRTGSKPGGVLKRVIRFKSCEKPNIQPDYLFGSAGLLARFHAAIFIRGSNCFMTRPFPAFEHLIPADAGFFW